MADRAPRGIRLRGDEAADRPEGVYSIHARCGNCEWTGAVDVPKGTPVPVDSNLDNLARCEECGCHTLVRIAKPEPAPADQRREETDAFSERMRRLIEEAQERERRRERPASPLPQIPITQPAPWVTPRPYQPIRPPALPWPNPNYWTAPPPGGLGTYCATGDRSIQPNITQVGKLSDGTPIRLVEP